jgi:nucleoside-diphosphate-sugar epimerase
MKKTILVTGGTGFIGSWIAKGLLEKGYLVKISVRDINQKEKYQHLLEISKSTTGTLEIFQANLLQAGSFDEAAQGCESIVHTASPFILKVKNPEKELIDPAVKGTENILEAANKSGTVKKVVLTSSVGAIYGDKIDIQKKGLSCFTEEHFNTSSSARHQPYEFSKVKAEKKAWEMVEKQSQWQLIVMNPSFVMGPPLNLNTQSESLKVFNKYLSGDYKSGVPELHFGFVDVRDVAKAHIFAVENEANGRHILVERVTDLLSFSNIIKEHGGDTYNLPKSFVPKWFLYVIGLFIGMSRKYINRSVGIPIQLDNTRSKKRLKLKYTPLEKTVKDMIDQIENQK